MFEPTGVKIKPDIIFADRSKEKLYLTIEVKTFFYFKDPNNQSIVNEYKNGNNRIIRNVTQIYNYMIGSKSKYGLLTSVTQSFFLKNVNGSLYISELIDSSKLLKCLFFMFLKAKNEYDENFVNLDEKANKNPGTNQTKHSEGLKISTENSQEINFFLQNFYFPDAPIIGEGQSGCVVKTNLSDQPIAVKLTDLFKCPKEIKLELKNEVEILKILKKLKKSSMRTSSHLVWYFSYIQYHYH